MDGMPWSRLMSMTLLDLNEKLSLLSRILESAVSQKFLGLKLLTKDTDPIRWGVKKVFQSYGRGTKQQVKG
jgi:hypothetical protein